MKSTDLLNLVLPASGYDKTQFSYGVNKRQAYDLYLPKAKQHKTPIVFVYGGAWRSGAKKDYEFVAHALTELGHPVMIPDYRLYPEAKFPAFIEDVADAIANLNQRAASALGKPLDTFILMGHSSGAHTAALLATDKQYLQQRQIKSKLGGLIGMAGPYDLPLDDEEVTAVFPNISVKQAKPLMNIHPGMPPTLLLHGKDDERVLPLHTRRFGTALKNQGTMVKMHLYGGVNHTRLVASLAAPLRFLNNSYTDIKSFLADLDNK